MQSGSGLPRHGKSLVNNSSRIWVAIEIRVTAEASEAVEYGLMEAGALGTETRDLEDSRICVTAYFDQMIDEGSVRSRLLEAHRIYDLSPSLPLEITIVEVPDQDWLAEWKKDWQPVQVGECFIVAPPWSEINDAKGRIVIRIEPGMAFGTGTHETTRLCLAAIEKYFRGGSFLDVGTGTGVLAIAAAKLFPQSRVEACDTDVEAIAIARENARLNGVGEIIKFFVGSVAETSVSSADVVCANLTANVIIELLPSLLAVTCGRLILCGILVEQTDLVQSRMHELGASATCETITDGEWAAMIV